MINIRHAYSIFPLYSDDIACYRYMVLLLSLHGVTGDDVKRDDVAGKVSTKCEKFKSEP